MHFDKKGTILITSLWILTILSILAAGIGFRVSIEARLSKYNIDRLKGEYLAKAGVIKSQELLARDNNQYDSIRECGFIRPVDKEPQDIFSGKLSDGVFTVSYEEEGRAYYGMIDEERKININKAGLEVLQNLLSQENADTAVSIMNWRGPQLATGAQDDNYYNSLTPPYECKHAQFSCIEELMLVKGITPAIFASVKDYITVNGDGRVNLNTATARVMLAFGLSSPAVEEIINYRNGVDRIAGTKDDMVFYIMPRQGELQYLTVQDVAILGNNFTTVSNYFRIDSKGVVDRSRIISKIACVVKRGDRKLVSYREY